MRKKSRTLANAAEICNSQWETKLKAMLSVWPKKTACNTDRCAAVMATLIKASVPMPAARQRETNWFLKYERFLVTPQTLFKATSRGRKTPVDEISSMTTEATRTPLCA